MFSKSELRVVIRNLCSVRFKEGEKRKVCGSFCGFCRSQNADGVKTSISLVLFFINFLCHCFHVFKVGITLFPSSFTLLYPLCSFLRGMLKYFVSKCIRKPINHTLQV